MAVTAETLDTSVKRLESQAGLRASAYKLRVFLLATLGYTYIFFVLGALLLLVGLLVWLAATYRAGGLVRQLLFALCGLVFLILRALWVRIPPPEGLALTPQQAPTLFAAATEIRRALKAPKVHRILLTDEFNAAVAQRPRLGVFGWHKNYLIVGLPYLQALSPEQFRAVLAHEFGHLSGAHGRFGAWIYRIQTTWQQLLEALERKEHWGSLVFVPFFRWYAPFFERYSFVLRRAREYEADRAAAEVTGARTAADALLASTIKGAFLHRYFWPELFKEADRQPTPPAVFSRMQLALRATVAPEQAAQWVGGALMEQTGSGDTHPSLTDRLAALHQEAHVPPTAEETAAEYFLGGALAGLTEQLSSSWQEATAASWHERYSYVQNAHHQLAELEKRAKHAPLSLDDEWKRAALVDELIGDQMALPLYQTVLELKPDHAGAQYAVGRIELSQGQETGIAAIEKAMGLDADAILPGTREIYRFLSERGRHEEAEQYYRRAAQHAEVLDAAGDERSGLRFSDTYLPHGLSYVEVARLQEQLRRHHQIARAYLVRKEVHHFAERPLYALGLEARRRWWQSQSREKDRQLVAEVVQELDFPGEFIAVVVNNDRNGRLKKIMRKIPGSEVYQA